MIHNIYNSWSRTTAVLPKQKKSKLNKQRATVLPNSNTSTANTFYRFIQIMLNLNTYTELFFLFVQFAGIYKKFQFQKQTKCAFSVNFFLIGRTQIEKADKCLVGNSDSEYENLTIISCLWWNMYSCCNRVNLMSYFISSNEIEIIFRAFFCNYYTFLRNSGVVKNFKLEHSYVFPSINWIFIGIAYKFYLKRKTDDWLLVMIINENKYKNDKYYYVIFIEFVFHSHSVLT